MFFCVFGFIMTPLNIIVAYLTVIFCSSRFFHFIRIVYSIFILNFKASITILFFSCGFSNVFRFITSGTNSGIIDLSNITTPLSVKLVYIIVCFSTKWILMYWSGVSYVLVWCLFLFFLFIFFFFLFIFYFYYLQHLDTVIASNKTTNSIYHLKEHYVPFMSCRQISPKLPLVVSYDVGFSAQGPLWAG